MWPNPLAIQKSRISDVVGNCKLAEEADQQLHLVLGQRLELSQPSSSNFHESETTPIRRTSGCGSWVAHLGQQAATVLGSGLRSVSAGFA